MSDDSMFDPRESELRRRFDALAGGSDDTEIALDSLRPQLQRAKRRHRAVSTLGALAVVLVVVSVAFAALREGNDAGVRTPPAGSVPSITTTPGPDGAGGSAGTTTTLPDSSVRQRGSNGGGFFNEGDTPAAGTEAPGGAPVAEAPTSPVASETTSYSSDGGSITVTRTGDTVSLASNGAAAGYSAEVHDNGPTRVEVRFSNDDTEWRIRVDVVNGSLVPEITQHGA